MVEKKEKTQPGRKQRVAPLRKEKKANVEVQEVASVDGANSQTSPKSLRIRYVRSAIGFTKRQKETVRGLGLTKLNQVVERPDTPQIRGMVQRIPHLVTILESPL